jgi:bifunctional DNA-binding transcriptional regulator/antitoxin component of YhaV-PrlF toxin-antitoxin module
MGLLRRLFVPKEVKITLNLLDGLKSEFDSEAFQIIHSQIEKGILSDCKKVVAKLRAGISPTHFIYTAIANIAGDHAESGNYHIYRGVINPMSPGNDFTSLFNMAIDRLQQSGAISEKEAEEQKTGLRNNIKTVG